MSNHIVTDPLEPVIRTAQAFYDCKPVSSDEIIRRQNGGTVTIYIEGHPHKTNAITMSGAEIKALRGGGYDYQLFREIQPRHGGHDKYMGDGEAIYIHDGMHFYAVPPAIGA
jgi:hypothetical protein